MPLNGEKVRCPGCGQKLRFDADAGAPKEKPDAPLPPPEADEPPPLPSPSLPSPRLFAAPPLPEETPEPPPDKPKAEAPPLPDSSTPDPALDAEELHEMWPALTKLIGQIYEGGRVTAADRLVFRTDADRAGLLAQRLLPVADARFPHGYEVLASVLPRTSLDEIIGLSLEQFRRFEQSLDEAQALITRRLPRPEPEAEAAAQADTSLAPPVERRREKSFPIASALAALIILAVASVVAVPALRRRVLGHPAVARILDVGTPSEPAGPASPATPLTDTPASPTPQPRPAAPSSATPAVSRPEPPSPMPKTPTPAAKAPAPVRPEPKAKAAPVRRFPSRWKPGADGWIVLFDGKDLGGWLGVDGHWQVKDGELRGVGGSGVAFLSAREADWADYTLAAKVMLGTSGTAVVSHGVLAARMGGKEAGGVRLGYPQQGWRVLDEKPKGLARRKWYDVEFDVKGKQVEVRIGGQVALRSGAHEPLAGGPSLEALDGGVAFRDVRVKIHESDPDYRAVVLGEGYTDDPAARTVMTPATQGRDGPTAALRPGEHKLFDGRTLDGWTTRGAWIVREGQMVARAGPDQVATAIVPATAECSDYVIRARCRLLRRSDQAREGEYFFLVFRHQSPDLFYCMRLPTEGIFELGYYKNGRFRETTRGVRKGHFNEWHEIELTVRGGNVNMRVDNIGGLPTWPAKYFRRGAIGIGVTGGEAAFRDIRVRILR